MSYLVVNPVDRFSRVAAHIMSIILTYDVKECYRLQSRCTYVYSPLKRTQTYFAFRREQKVNVPGEFNGELV